MSTKTNGLIHDLEMQILGTMTMGRQINEQESHAILDEYIKLGGIWIDTAEIYPVPVQQATHGLTERIIGNWLANKVKSDASFRGKIAIASKVTGPAPNADYSPIKGQDFTKEVINRDLNQSLARLQTEYLDLYQLHWPSRAVPLWGQEKFTEDMVQNKHGMRPAEARDAPPVPFEDICRTMGELVASGKILSWGLSNETPYGVCQFVETCKRLGLPQPITIQQDFCLMDRRYDGALAEVGHHLNVKLLCYGALAGGTLTGKYLENESGKASAEKRAKLASYRHTLFPNFQVRYHAPPAMEATAKYQKVANANNISMLQLALGFVATRFYMGGLIQGCNSVEELHENFKAIAEAKTFWNEKIEADVLAVHRERPNPSVIY